MAGTIERFREWRVERRRARYRRARAEKQEAVALAEQVAASQDDLDKKARIFAAGGGN